MNKWIAAIVPALASGLLAGCIAARQAPAEPSRSPTTPETTREAEPTEGLVPQGCLPDGPWTLRLQVSGGIAGLRQELVVSSGGKLTARDLRRGGSHSFTLPAQTMDQLVDLIEASCPWEASRLQGSCADCFVYELELEGGAKPVRLQIDANHQVGEGVQKLLNVLLDLLASALKAGS